MDYPNREREKGLGNRKQKDAENDWNKEKGIAIGSEMYTQRSGRSGECLRMYNCVCQEAKGRNKRAIACVH